MRERKEGGKMRNPELFTAMQLKNWNTQIEKHTGVWVPARPLPFYGFRIFKNIQFALGVLVGKYDVVEWYKQ